MIKFDKNKIMVQLLIFILVAYGASNIMVYGSIFAKFRYRMGVDSENPKFFGKLFGCMMCLPFWWGVLLSLFFFSPTYMAASHAVESPLVTMGWVMGDEVNLIATFLDGCLASGAVWLVHTIQEKLEQ